MKDDLDKGRTYDLIAPVLDKEQLESLGLKRVTAYLTTKEPKAKQSGNAARQAKHRQVVKAKLEAAQLVVAPMPAHMAEFIEANPDAWTKLDESLQLRKAVREMPAWKQWLLRLLGLTHQL